MNKLRWILSSITLLGVLWGIPAAALPVSPATARQVALGVVRQHVVTFGTWGGSAGAAVQGVRAVLVGADTIAYDVRVAPQGHVLVAADDELAPVLLYSDLSSFDAARPAEAESVESWILSEVGGSFRRVREAARSRPAGTRPDRWQAGAAGRAWLRLAPGSVTPAPPAGAVAPEQAPLPSASVVSPLLTSSWSQGTYYNNYTPGVAGSCTHTVTGCVATAMGQLMRYWRWPATGTGSHSYSWNGQTLNASFDHAYNWTSMPDALSGASSPTAVDAVARLLSDAGIAVDMNYGCGASGGSDYRAAMVALPTYFGYQASVGAFRRSDHTAPEFYARIQQELDASPPRPVFFVIWTTGNTVGHALVIDGYQTTELPEVHLNFGWGGSYQGWYTIDENWSASYVWDAQSQFIWPGIQPLPPVVPGAFGKTSPSNGATQTPRSALRLAWQASVTATSYEYCIDTTNDGACGASWISSASSTEATLSSLAPGTTYFWQVRARNAAGITVADSAAWWSFTTAPLPVFTDNPLVGGVTPVKAVHLSELRGFVDQLRARYKLPAMTWTGTPLVARVSPIAAQHLVELRTALGAVYAAANRTAPTYSAPAIVPGSSIIRAADIAELRAAIVAIW